MFCATKENLQMHLKPNISEKIMDDWFYHNEGVLDKKGPTLKKKK